MAVAVVLSSGGNQRLEMRGGAAMMVIPAIPSSMAQMWLLKITENTSQVIDYGYSSYSIQHGEDVTARNYRETVQVINDGNSR